MRSVVVIAALAIAAPPILSALVGLGFSMAVSCGIVLAGAAFCVHKLSPRVPAAVIALLARRLVLALWLVTVLAATVQTARLTRFMVEPSRADDSILPGRAFFRVHSCLTSYVEAARLAPTGANIFDPAQYHDVTGPGDYRSHYIGPFEVDLYQYPPGFLLLPQLAAKSGLDFFDTRRLWFGVQATSLFATMLALALWIGGRAGATAALFVPFVWVLPPVLLGLQLGNFQATAFALSVAAMLAFERRWMLAGGAALGFATVSKIFPGVLGLLLVGTRLWRPVAWTAALAIALTVVAVATLGVTPFVHFVTYQLPRLESGEAFFWIELVPTFAVVNQSIYGLITKLRLLGVPATDPWWARAISSAYALLLVPLAYVASRRVGQVFAADLTVEQRRLRQAQVWLALLTLASLRSPFVPDAYGMVGTLWLLSLVAAERKHTPLSLAGFGVVALAFSIVLDGGLVPDPAPTWMVAGTLVVQWLAIALNVASIARPVAPGARH